MPVDTVPDMVKPVHHRDGWVGLPTEERHEGGRTWWVRSRPGPAAEFDVIDPGWEDCYFTDVDASGTRILTTSASLDDGIIQVRSFPGLDIVRTIKPQDATHPWGHMACFSDDLIIVTVIDFNTGDQTRGAVDPAGTFHPMPGDCEREWIDPATDGTWLIGTGTTLRRYRATRR
jgi:hypothetical protein